MSMGYGGYMTLIESDESMLVYSYCCYNVNHDDWQMMKTKKDGVIFIERDAFVEPDIHVKRKRCPNGKKMKVAKRIIKPVPFEQLFSDQKIRIENASGTWQVSSDGNDVIALKLLRKLFYEYQEKGTIPEHISFFA